MVERSETTTNAYVVCGRSDAVRTDSDENDNSTIHRCQPRFPELSELSSALWGDESDRWPAERATPGFQRGACRG